MQHETSDALNPEFPKFAADAAPHGLLDSLAVRRQELVFLRGAGHDAAIPQGVGFGLKLAQKDETSRGLVKRSEKVESKICNNYNGFIGFTTFHHGS
jgi:hypothetical protein